VKKVKHAGKVEWRKSTEQPKVVQYYFTQGSHAVLKVLKKYWIVKSVWRP